VSNLNTLMSRATADLAAAPAPTTLDADLSRGHQARRRRARLAGSGVGGAFAITAAVGIGFASSAAPAAAVELVAYTEQQPAGFTIAEIPDGWHVLSSDAGSLMLADADDTGADPSSFEGRIVATLVGTESLPSSLDAQTFTVDGDRTLVYEMLGADSQPSGTLGVFVPEGDGGYLSVQLPPELGWSGEVAAQFAGGLDVTGAAEPTRG
jgi:hypothetical protein